ncbi:MAG: YebC/PmpR family DNA-binding transcriptional regulator [Dehalococcoidia bacterium]|nr:YebC/PmpR family DNA-binding transcriptional regulator [Dehalococcoidia bacterium]
MSGHSKWSTIKRAKGVTDAKRGQVFTKLAREIVIAARQGGGDITFNSRLRLAVQRARDGNMPADNIDRAIKRAVGADGGAAAMEEITYEGYGPGGMAILIQVVTENKNRTAAEVRSNLTKHGGSMAEAGSVSWMFQTKGVLTVEAPEAKAEEIALKAIDAGADDFSIEEGHLEVYCPLPALESLRHALEAMAPVTGSEISPVPTTTVPLDTKHAGQALRLLERLEELDDVQRVYTNADFPAEALAQLSTET